MKLKNQKILIISNEPWGDIWYSKHHYANELSKNNTVFFLNPPSEWKLKNLFLSSPKITSINPSLSLISYSNIFPLTGIFNMLYFINDRLICKKLKKILIKENAHNPIFWTFDPYRLLNPKKFNPIKSIYQSMDMYNWNREKWLVQNVDLILTVSKKIAAKFNEEKTPVFIIPHGIAENKSFIEDLLIPENENTILLIGTISSRIDFELLYKIAYKFQSYTLKIIGPTLKHDFSKDDYIVFEKLKQLPNVIFLGTIPFEELSKNINKSKLAICTYKQNSLGNKLNSLKIKQYLSYGKNTLTTPMEELQDLADRGLLEMCSEHDIFLDLCEKSLKNQPSTEKIKERIDYTKEYLYSKILEQIEGIIQNHNHEAKKYF